MNFLVVGLNLMGVLIGLYSVWVTVRLFHLYRLKTMFWFVTSSVSITIWNLLHLLFLFLPEDTTPSLIRPLWIILLFSGMTFLFTFILGYHRLQYVSIQPQVFFYLFFAGFVSAVFITKPDWITYTYNQIDGFATLVLNNWFWNIFSLISAIIVVIEILLPIYIAFREEDQHSLLVMIMIISVFLSIFSNFLLPVFQLVGLPQSTRFVVANLGFLLFFSLILRYPFLGLYDTSELQQVIISSISGEPLLVLTHEPLESSPNSILTSGAFSSINAILEEITRRQYLPEEEQIRIIELGETQFFLVLRNQLKIIFHYIKPTGVSRAKFKSLARLLPLETVGLSHHNMDEITTRLSLYFPDFNMYSQFYQIV